MPSTALDRIKLRRLVLQIRLGVEDIVDSLLFDSRSATHMQAGYLRETTRELLAHYEREGHLSASTTACSYPTGWVARQRRDQTIVALKMSDKTSHQEKRVFYGRRRARVYAKRLAKSLFLLSMCVQPVTSCENIQINVRVVTPMRGAVK